MSVIKLNPSEDVGVLATLEMKVHHPMWTPVSHSAIRTVARFLNRTGFASLSNMKDSGLKIIQNYRKFFKERLIREFFSIF